MAHLAKSIREDETPTHVTRARNSREVPKPIKSRGNPPDLEISCLVVGAVPLKTCWYVPLVKLNSSILSVGAFRALNGIIAEDSSCNIRLAPFASGAVRSKPDRPTTNR